MAHIHELIDLVVSAFIVHPTEPKVLLVHHKGLNGWYAVGGHVELHETTDEALDREIEEETGLIVGKTVNIMQPVSQVLRANAFAGLDPKKNHSAKQLRVPW